MKGLDEQNIVEVERSREIAGDRGRSHLSCWRMRDGVKVAAARAVFGFMQRMKCALVELRSSMSELRSLMKRRDTELNEAPNHSHGHSNDYSIPHHRYASATCHHLCIISPRVAKHAPFLPPPADGAENRPASSGSDDLSIWSVKSAQWFGD